MSRCPKSPKEMTGGMMYFPRMLDFARPMLERINGKEGIAHRADIATIPDLIDLDEGRRS